jgi:carbamoyltransferase
MITWGINALNHGSSLAVFSDGRLTMLENSVHDRLDSKIIYDAFNYGGPNTIFWYERPWLKKLRQLSAGQWNRVFDLSDLPSTYIKEIKTQYADLRYTPHHASHAAAGYYTSPFDHCAIVVLDAIGEFECASIWEGKHGEMRKVWSRSYPNSLGLFYSAFTQALGMTPIRDEWKLQAMAENGNPLFFYYRVQKYFTGLLELNYNFHKGVKDQKFYIDSIEDECNLAAAVQMVFEDQIRMIMLEAKKLVNTDCLVYMGGCAMNSDANKRFVEPAFKYRWSLPNPGDPSSAIGAVLYHTKQRVWNYNFGVAKHLEISV